MPPLRERKEDIPPLVDHFIQQFSIKSGKEIKGLTPQATQKLMLYDWPGNVRELENVIEYAVAMGDKDRITEDLILGTRSGVSQDKPQPLKEAKDAFEMSYLVHLLQTCKGNVSEASSSPESTAQISIPCSESIISTRTRSKTPHNEGGTAIRPPRRRRATTAPPEMPRILTFAGLVWLVTSFH